MGGVIRVDALLSRYGYCSRREARRWTEQGRVVYAGAAVKKADAKVDPHAVLVDGEPVAFPDGLYVAVNKPLGYTCSHDEAGDLVYDLLPPQWLNRANGINTVGRLDKNTSGLLLVTDDGAFLHALTAPGKHVPKVYEFETEAPVPEEAVELFAAGTLVLNGEKTPCKPAELRLSSPCTGELTLHEGRYHQVRRMLAAVGAPVVRLHRSAIGPLKLEDLHLQAGEWTAIDPKLFS